jgi:hypothetical protein
MSKGFPPNQSIEFVLQFHDHNVNLLLYKDFSGYCPYLSFKILDNIVI